MKRLSAQAGPLTKYSRPWTHFSKSAVSQHIQSRKARARGPETNRYMGGESQGHEGDRTDEAQIKDGKRVKERWSSQSTGTTDWGRSPLLTKKGRVTSAGSPGQGYWGRLCMKEVLGKGRAGRGDK